MKIIQSFWSKPAFHTVQDFYNSRKIGGWSNIKDFLVSFTFSCLTLKKHHKEVNLYTDTNGKRILLDDLKLPYDNASLVLDELDSEDHRLWIRGKMIAIKLQDAPFIHVDNDVFVWTKLPCSDDPAFLVGQNFYPMSNQYKSTLNEVVTNFRYVPDCLMERPTKDTMVTNVGIIGGNNIDFFQDFCKISTDLLERNRDRIHLTNVGGFNQMMEEYLYTALIRQRNLKIDYLIQDQNHHSYLLINLVPIFYKYIHLVYLSKQSAYACEQLALRLRYEFPTHYKIIDGILKERYPDLLDQSGARQQRLLRSLNVFYTHTLDQILDLKIVVSEGIEIVEIADFLGGKAEYIAKETEPATGKINYWKIPTQYSNNDCLKYFRTPMSLNEVIEDVEGLSKEADTNDLRFWLIDAVTRNIVIVGVLEFA